MGRGLILWLVGIPLPVILVLYFLGYLHWEESVGSCERRARLACRRQRERRGQAFAAAGRRRREGAVNTTAAMRRPRDPARQKRSRPAAPRRSGR